MGKKICIVTSAHPVLDARIFYKQAKSLKKNGFNVSLIAPHDKEEIIEGIKIKPIKKTNNLLYRRTIILFNILHLALKQNANIYHLHDLELIIPGIILKLFGKKVIYDFHEDKYLSFKNRKGVINRYILSPLVDILQKLATKFFYTILAEKFYAKRIDGDINILNYPLKSKFNKINVLEQRKNQNKNILLYTGRVTKNRGAINHVKILNYIEDIEVHLIGYCEKELAEELKRIAGDNKNRLYIEGENYFVPYERILEYYHNEHLLAGLSVFPDIPKLTQKELTKFFEYMAAGLPIICTDSPTWNKLIEENKVGITVNPNEIESFISAVKYLKNNPKKALKMSLQGEKISKTKYNWSIEEKKLLQFYKKIISN
ncbi:MAG: glycosyltransferase [archaeon]